MKIRYQLACIASTSLLLLPIPGVAQSPGSGAVLVEEIVVTGLRGSLDRAQEIKREADAMVEVISMQDLGNFSDETVIDALQRVPGVQIQRNDDGAVDGGDSVTIRGVGPQFVQTTVNGRTPLSAGAEGITNLREFNYGLLPTEVLSGLTIYKTPTAGLPEPGIGGSVDVQTLNPFNAGQYEGDRNFFGVVNLRSQYNDVTEDSGPRVSGVFGMKNESETIAGYIAAVTSETETRNSTVLLNRPDAAGNIGTVTIDNDLDGVQSAGDTVYENVTWGAHSFQPIDRTIERESVTTKFVFRPSETVEITADLLYAEFNDFQDRDQGGAGGFAAASNAGVFAPGAAIVENGQIQYADFSQLTTADGSLPNLNNTQVNVRLDNEVESLIGGLNVSWDLSDSLNVKFDYSYSTLESLQTIVNEFAIRATVATAPAVATAIYDGRGNIGFVSFDDPTNSLMDPDNYPAIAAGNLLSRQFQNDSERNAFRIDASKRFDDGSSFDFGLRHESTTIDVRTALPGNAIRGFDQPFEDVRDQVIVGFEDPYLDDYLPASAYNTVFDIDGDIAAALALEGRNVSAVGTAVFEDDIISAAASTVDGIPPAGPSFFESEETTFAVYGQFNFQGDFGDMPFEGNVGLRLVNTEVESIAFSTVRVTGLGLDEFDQPIADLAATFVPTQNKDDYWNLLPSVNLNFELREDLNLRVGLSEVMSRPAYVDQVPINNLTYNLGLDDAADAGITGTAGNAGLAPYTATQVDFSLEYYTDNGGAFYTSLFYKEISDFIATAVFNGATVDTPWDFSDPDALLALAANGETPATGVFQTTADATVPENLSDAFLLGFEIGFDQPLDGLLPMDNFGVLGNFTWIESEFDDDSIEDYGFGFPGSSENNFNFQAYYDDTRFSARLAYTFRDDYLRSLAGSGDRRGAARFTEAQEDLTLNLSYAFENNLTVSLSAVNLTGEDRRDYLGGVSSNFGAYVERPRIYTLGARYSF